MANYGNGNFGRKGKSEGYNQPDDEFLSEALTNLKRCRRVTMEWRIDAREDYDFYAGRQWAEEDEAVLREQLRPIITFNRTAPMVDAVIGTEVNNRQEVKYFPREVGDAGVNEMFTAAAAWVRENCDAEDEETDAFMDTLICGMGWTETRVDYEEELDGKILIDRFDPLEALWDIDARKRNLSDARWVARQKDIPKAEFDAMWPDKADAIMPNADVSALDVDTGLEHDADEAWKYENDQAENDQLGYDAQAGTYRVIQYQCRKKVPVYRVLNPASGEVEELDQETWGKVGKQLEGMGLQPVKQFRYAYHQAFICGRTLLERGPCPVNGFTLRCITGKRDRNKSHWFGLVRAMKDPQRWANKFFSQILHVLNTNAKGGILAEQSVFPDPDRAQADWAKPDSLLMVNDGSLGMNPRIMPKPIGTYPQGTDRLMEFSLMSLKEVTGVNVEMMGLANRDQPGVLESERKKAGLTILALIFDSLRRYRKEQGRVLLEFIQKYISDGRLIRVNGTLGQQYMPLVRDPETVQYDIIVDEAPSSVNQKEQVWAVLSPMLPNLLKMNIPIPPSVVDYMPIPESLAQEWKQIMQGGDQEQQQRQQEQQQRQQEAEVAKVEGEALVKRMEAMLKEAQAIKTQAEAQMAQAEAMVAQLDPMGFHRAQAQAVADPKPQPSAKPQE